MELPASELDPEATFAAHRVPGGFQIDRLQGGGIGVVEPARWITWRRPEFRVRARDATLGRLWLTAPGQLEIQESGSPFMDNIEPTWDDGAIRLTLRSGTGASLRCGPFERIGGSNGYSVLSRNAQTLLDVRGAYRAVIIDATGHPVGWWQVHIAEPYQPRLFEGAVLGVSPVDEAGLTVALNSEIDWIENQALDVYRGTSSGHLDGRSNGR